MADKNDDTNIDPLKEEDSAPGAEENRPEPKGLEQPPDEYVKPVVAFGTRRSRLKQWFTTHKKTTVLLVLIIVVAILAAVPFTRYTIAGLVLKQQYKVVVTDSQTGKPVTSAQVTLDGKEASTDNKGMATFKLRVGPGTLRVAKKYYRTQTSHTVVPILKQKNAQKIHLQATGRQVPVVVTNKLSGKPLANAKVKAADTEAKTDKDGRLTIVLPADKSKVTATITANGYNAAKVTLQVKSDSEKTNSFALTPSGKVYFLSNLNGKIDVVKTNLDGTSREVAVAGSGFERDNETSLLASRDWKFLVLKAVRDASGKAKMYIINTATDKITTFDEGDADFRLVGWYNHQFVYAVTRTQTQQWQNGRQALKSYNADSGQLVTLDQTQGSGDATKYAGQVFDNFYILPNTVVYSVTWNWVVAPDPTIDGKTSAIRAISPSGQGKKDYKTFDPLEIAYITARLYEPGGVYFAVYSRAGGDPAYYEFEDNAVKDAKGVSNESFAKSYPTYLVSPSGNHVFWSESRDGKNTLFTGDKAAQSAKQLATLSEYQAYGWYTDEYLLVSKESSELYVMPVSGGKATKVTDYYKPAITYSGYGYGYGGL